MVDRFIDWFMAQVEGWTIGGSEALPLFGDTHVPDGASHACLVLLHGYLGYKDYGFIPVLAERLARSGVTVHRFNFAHSGMTNSIVTFERPDLFERQTWNAQIYDALCVIDAVRAGRLRGQGLPMVLAGHSRGGVSALLTAGRHRKRLGLAGAVTLAAPSACCGLSEETQGAWLESGRLIATSNRTGQQMSISSRWLEEQIADPVGHDVLFQTAQMGVPLLAIHGSADESVPVACVHQIVAAAGDEARALVLRAGNHVFGMPNPPDRARRESEPFLELAGSVERFVRDCADNSV